MKIVDPMTLFVLRPKWVRNGFLCAGLVASMCDGVTVFGQRPPDGAARQQLYLVAATLTVKGQPSGYPVTLYQVTGGKLEVVREIISPGPDALQESSTSICCVRRSNNALYFLYPYYRSTTVSIVHFDDPARMDDVKFNSEAAFTDGGRTAVFPRSASGDELLIPITTDFSDPAHLKGTLTDIVSTMKGSQVTPNSDAWNDYGALQWEGEVGGPALQTGPGGVLRAGNNLAISVVGHTVVLDALPPSLRGATDRSLPVIFAVNQKYLLIGTVNTSEAMASGKLGDTSRVFVHDRASNQWKVIRVEGNAPRTRLFGTWLTAAVTSWNPGHAPNPGRDDERSEATDRLPDIQSRYRATSGSGQYSIPGILVLQNLADDRRIRIVTRKEDSEILNVNGDTVFYRVNDTIYQARIAGSQLQDPSVVVKDEDVPEVHWIFWSK
jgi:hypothetical protein